MPHEQGHLDATGGGRLYRQSWLPDGEVRTAIVLVHGAAEHSGRYPHLVGRLVPEGHAIHALDHRGHGRSEGPRALIEKMDHAVSDVDTLVDLARAAHPGVPLVMFGHSMGGGLALQYALRHQHKLDGLVLSAPVTLIEAPAALRLTVRTLSKVAPRAGVVQVSAAGISRDPDEVRRYDGDELVYRGKLPARTVAELADLCESFPQNLQRLTLPLLVLHGTADTIVAPKGSHTVVELAGSTDKKLSLYEGYFHELHNEPPAERAKPLDELAAWLEQRQATASV